MMQQTIDRLRAWWLLSQNDKRRPDPRPTLRVRLFVCAASMGDAEAWRIESGVAPRDMIYVSDPYIMRGVRISRAQLIQLRGYSNHPKWQAISQAAEMAVNVE